MYLIMLGMVLDEAPYTALYSGLYGRHSLLTTLSLGGFFFVLNFYSTLAGVFGGVLATIIFHALKKVCVTRFLVCFCFF